MAFNPASPITDEEYLRLRRGMTRGLVRRTFAKFFGAKPPERVAIDDTPSGNYGHLKYWTGDGETGANRKTFWDGGDLAFERNGKDGTIGVYDTTTERNVLAALQLAAQTWPQGFRITEGDEDFRRLCERLASEHSLPLLAPAPAVKAMFEGAASPAAEPSSTAPVSAPQAVRAEREQDGLGATVTLKQEAKSKEATQEDMQAELRRLPDLVQRGAELLVQSYKMSLNASYADYSPARESETEEAMALREKAWDFLANGTPTQAKGAIEIARQANTDKGIDGNLVFDQARYDAAIAREAASHAAQPESAQAKAAAEEDEESVGLSM